MVRSLVLTLSVSEVVSRQNRTNENLLGCGINEKIDDKCNYI